MPEGYDYRKPIKFDEFKGAFHILFGGLKSFYVLDEGQQIFFFVVEGGLSLVYTFTDDPSDVLPR